MLARIFKPSLSDCFFIALILWLFVWGASGWIALLGDGDTGWHIRTGQYILEHHRVPTQDLFSFSRPGAPWFAWEWLTDVTYAVSFQMAGLKAIVLVAAVMIALFATVVLRYTLWRGANALVAALTTLLAVGASSMHFLARPHLFTLLLLPVCLWLVEADRRENTRWLWALIPVTAVWTNLHGGFVIFLACLGLLVAGLRDRNGARPSSKAGAWPQIRRYSALLAGCSLASLANPYGVQLHVHISEYLRADWIKNMVQEFQAPTFRSEGQLQYEAVAAGRFDHQRLPAPPADVRRSAVGAVPGPLVAHQRAACSALCRGRRAAHCLRDQRVVAGCGGGAEEVLGLANSVPVGGGSGAGLSPHQRLAGRIHPVLWWRSDAPFKWPRDFPERACFRPRWSTSTPT